MLTRGDLGAIAAGGVTGAFLRWFITKQDATDGGWFAYEPNTSARRAAVDFELPLDTLFVNLLGCLLLGALTLLLRRTVPIPRRVLIAAATGFCGSLTTFSTFAVEVAEMLRGFPVPTGNSARYPADYEVAFGTALAYLLLSLIGGALAFALGRSLAKRIVTSPGDVTIEEAT